MSSIRFIINKYFILFAGLFVISAVFFCNATHGLYLYDAGIVYNYGYLLNLGYKPFTDFPTPLLPFSGLLQSTCYKIFGLNYLSGVIGAWIIVLFQFTITYLTLLKIRSGNFWAIAYAFLIALTCIAFVGNLAYNNLLMALISIVTTQAVYIYWVLLNHNSKSITARVILQYVLIACIFTIKLQVGTALFAGIFFLDLGCYWFILKTNFRQTFRQAFIRAATFALIAATILLITHANFLDYLNGIKHISMVKNILPNQIKSFLSLPLPGSAMADIAPIIVYLPCVFYLVDKMNLSHIFHRVLLCAYVILLYLGPVLVFHLVEMNPMLLRYVLLPLVAASGLFLLFALLYLVKTLKNTPAIKYLFLFLFITLIYWLSLLIVMNSLERINIIMSILIFFILAFDYLIFEEDAYFFQKLFKPVILLALLAYALPYSVYSIRKNYDENYHGDIVSGDLALCHNKFTPAYPELYNFFNHLNVSRQKINDFIAIDSMVKLTPSRKILFGGGLEMFNAVYRIKPPLSWPLWYHWQLTVTAEDTTRMQKIVEGEKFDLIVLSRRPSFILNNSYILERIIARDYDTTETDGCRICVRRKTI